MHRQVMDTAAPPVVCTRCRRPVDGRSCLSGVLRLAGQSYAPVLHQPAPTDSAPCPGCQTPPGRAHHGGCPDEACPRCSGLLASCGCAGVLA